MDKKIKRRILAVVTAIIFFSLYFIPETQKYFLQLYPSAQPYLSYFIVVLLSVCSFFFFWDTSNRVTVIAGFTLYIALRFLCIGSVRSFLNAMMDPLFLLILGFLGLGWWIGGK